MPWQRRLSGSWKAIGQLPGRCAGGLHSAAQGFKGKVRLDGPAVSFVLVEANKVVEAAATLLAQLVIDVKAQQRGLLFMQTAKI